MPLYDYQCPSCQHRFEQVLKIAELSKRVFCPRCSGDAERRLSRPMVRGDYEAYDCPITGRRIEGKRQHEENLRRHGCRVLEPGETREAMRNREKVQEQELERTIDKIVDTVAQEIGGIPD